jgi:molybdenum cofactor cytidylyltransferase
MIINGLVLAAGLSSRMGDFKPLMRAGGRTLIESCIGSLLAAGVDRVMVVLGYRADEVETLLHEKFPHGSISTARNPSFAETDMMASIKIGIRAMPPCDAFYLLPGDIPAVAPRTFQELRDAMQKSGAMVVFPTICGKRAHPPLISDLCITAILDFSGEGGLQEIWRQFGGLAASVEVADRGCLIDVDTPQDFLDLLEYEKTRKSGSGGQADLEGGNRA